MLVLLLGCTQPSTSALYRLKLSPEVPLNQTELMGDMDSINLTLMNLAGESSDPIEMGKPVSGTTLKGTGPDFEISWVKAEGEGSDNNGDDISAWGRTPVLGENLKSSLLMAQTNMVGQLAPTDSTLYGAQITALGNGEFLVSGGGTGTSASDLWRRFSLGEVDAELALVEEGTLPPYEDPTCTNCEALSARTGHSVVTLGGADKGKYLLTGGASRWANTIKYDWTEWEEELATIADTTVVYDPVEQSVEAVEHGETRLRKLGHHAFQVATAMPDGGAVWWGGWTNDVNVRENLVLEVLAGGTRTTSVYAASDFPDLDWPGPLGAAAVTTDAGAVICGGGGTNVDNLLESTDACILIANGSEPAQFPHLPVPLSGLSLISLDGEQILAIGGASMPIATEPDKLYFEYYYDGYPASSLVYVYNGSKWDRLMDIGQPIAGHRSMAFPDGRVLIYGGADYYSYYAYPTPITDTEQVSGHCVSVLDVNAGTVYSLNGCYDNPFQPAVAMDPEFGMLETGGMNNGTTGSLGVNFIPAKLF